MRLRKVLVFGIAVLMVAMFMASCGEKKGEEAKTVTIGLTAPLSGVGAGYGEDIKAGLDMAIKKINDAGGVTIGDAKYKFKLNASDDQAAPEAALSNVTRFVLQEGINIVWDPYATTITKLMDQAKDIRLMVADLENNIISGLILLVGVLMFVMGFRNALIVSMAIPFSMLITFSVLQALGISLNMVVLFSLTLALGMLVDNAIVIVENAYRFMEQGVPRVRAAMRATGEVAWAVINSTATTLAAFFPLIFLSYTFGPKEYVTTGWLMVCRSSR
jgi:predicted RND superfamily exporter protein